MTPAVWEGAIDRQTWDHVRSVLLNPERLTLKYAPTKYLLSGPIFCGVCGGRMASRPRDKGTRRYVCAGDRPGHELAILARPVDDLVAERALDLLRHAELSGIPLSAAPTGATTCQCGTSPRRSRISPEPPPDAGRRLLRRRSAAKRRYRSIRARLEREVERLHALVDAASRQRIVLHPDPTRLWSDADFGQQRELVRLIVERVDVTPAIRDARFDPARVKLTIPFASSAPESTCLVACTAAS